jgi:hypothetical protein
MMMGPSRYGVVPRVSVGGLLADGVMAVGMSWKRRGLAGCAGGSLALALVLGACGTAVPALTQPAASGASPWAAITATRAGYVRMMLSNDMAMAPLNVGGLDQVVLGYGGGYVLSLSASGTISGGSELHTADVVLGVTLVQDRMQGEGYFGLAAVECYQYSIGYVAYLVSYVPIACPLPDSPSVEGRNAQEWAVGLQAAEAMDTVSGPGTVPASMMQAKRLMASDLRRAVAEEGAAGAAGRESLSDFADGIDRQPGNEYGTTSAAMAVPLGNGTCAYVSFGYMVVNSGARQLAIGGTMSPWRAACTGQAALAAVAPFSVDPGLGG